MPVLTRLVNTSPQPGFFQKTLHPVVLVQLYQAVFQRVALPMQQQGDGGLAGFVAGTALPQVEITDAVSGKDQKILVAYKFLRRFDPVGGARGSCSTK